MKPEVDWQDAPLTWAERLTCLGVAAFFGIILWVVWWIAYLGTHPVQVVK